MNSQTTFATNINRTFPAGGRLFKNGSNSDDFGETLPEALLNGFIVDSETLASRADVNGFRGVLNQLPDGALIVSRNREVLFVNQALIQMLGCPSADEMIGKYPGDVLRCIHNREDACCGHNESCRHCNFNKALIRGLSGLTRQSEFKIDTADGISKDLLVKSTPVQFEGQSGVLSMVSDISDYKSREIADRVFFHDLLNTAAGLRNIADMMRDSSGEEAEEFRKMSSDLATRLCEDIQAQQMLYAAEANNLYVGSDVVDSQEMLEEIRQAFSKSDNTHYGRVSISPDSVMVKFVSDSTILTRVLSILTKNAVEASGATDRVRLSCVPSSCGAKFTVHNAAYIPLEDQKQIFRRFFSTKGRGRGMGTYSARLYTENYLGGEINFHSNPFFGTEFSVWVPDKGR